MSLTFAKGILLSRRKAELMRQETHQLQSLCCYSELYRPNELYLYRLRDKLKTNIKTHI